MTQPIPQWASDDLTKFFDIARNNLLASFTILRDEYEAISAIDAAFLKLLQEFRDPENVGVAPFAFRAHSAFRAAAQFVLSGQLPEAYMIMRGCLENALYANHIDVKSEAWDLWTKRGNSEQDRKKCVKEFAGRTLFDSLRSRDERLAVIAGELYDRTIDFGAHPNALAVTSSLTVTEGVEETNFDIAYVTADGLALRLGLKSLGQTGLIVLDTFCHVFPKRCAALGIAEMLDPIKPGF